MTARLPSVASLPRLRDDIVQCSLAALDHSNGAPQSRSEVFRIGDGSFAVNAQATRNGCVVDIGIPDFRADTGIDDAALMPVGHALDMHDLLMVGPIVVHHAEQRNAVMRG